MHESNKVNESMYRRVNKGRKKNCYKFDIRTPTSMVHNRYRFIFHECIHLWIIHEMKSKT